MKNDKILIIRTGGLGDSLLLWPALRALRNRFSLARIELMGIKERLAPMVVPGGADFAWDINGSGYHKLLQADADIPQELVERFGSFDKVIAFSSVGDLALGENLSSCGVDEVHVFLPFPPPRSGVHVARHTLDLLSSVELVDQGSMLELSEDSLPITDLERVRASEILDELELGEKPLVLMAPGSGSEKKTWFAKGFLKVARELSNASFDIVLIEGPADKAAVGRILESLPSLKVLRHTTPGELKGLMAKSRLFVGNDSGLAHLAGIVGLASVVVFKASDPEMWKPLGPVTVVSASAAAQNAGRDADPDDVLRVCDHLLDPRIK